MPDWYLWIFAISFLYMGISVIAFRKITVRLVNRKIKEAGEYYLSTEDKVGHTLFSIALAVILPLKWAEVHIPKAMIDAHSVKKMKLSTHHTILSISYLIAITSFSFIALYGIRFT